MNNFNPEWSLNKLKFNHSSLIPPSFRMLIIGSSGCGKSFRLFNMLLEPGFLDYNRLFIFSPSIHQPEYQLLIHGFQNKLHKYHIQSIIENQKKLGINDPEEAIKIVESWMEKEDKWDEIECHTFDSISDLPEPQDIDKTKKNLFIIDDSMMLNQKPIENFFVYGRHNNINIIYLAQSYFQLPKKSIRDNANYIILFPQNATDIQSLHRFVTSSDFDKIDDFKCFCKESWKEPYSFITIEKDNKDRDKRYSRGFGNFINRMNLLELKKKAVQSEDTLRDAYSQQRKMKLGFTESASKLFQPIVKPLEELKQNKESAEKKNPPIYPTHPLPGTLNLNEPIFGLQKLNHFDEDEYIFGALFIFYPGLDITIHPDPYPHRIYIDLEDEIITAYKPAQTNTRDDSYEVELTPALMALLTNDLNHPNV